MFPCLERITLRESGKWGISDLAWAVTNSELSFSKQPEGIGHMYLGTQRLVSEYLQWLLSKCLGGCANEYRVEPFYRPNWLLNESC